MTTKEPRDLSGINGTSIVGQGEGEEPQVTMPFREFKRLMDERNKYEVDYRENRLGNNHYSQDINRLNCRVTYLAESRRNICAGMVIAIALAALLLGLLVGQCTAPTPDIPVKITIQKDVPANAVVEPVDIPVKDAKE